MYYCAGTHAKYFVHVDIEAPISVIRSHLKRSVFSDIKPKWIKRPRINYCAASAQCLCRAVRAMIKYIDWNIADAVHKPIDVFDFVFADGVDCDFQDYLHFLSISIPNTQ